MALGSWLCLADAAPSHPFVPGRSCLLGRRHDKLYLSWLLLGSTGVTVTVTGSTEVHQHNEIHKRGKAVKCVIASQ